MNHRSKLYSQILLAILFIGYWFFVWNLEQIDYENSPPRVLVNMADVYPLIGIIAGRLTLLLELLSPRVLRHLVPVIVGWWAARAAVSHFIASFYDLPRSESGASMLHRLAADTVGRGNPIRLQPENFREYQPTDPLLSIGGPLLVEVDVGYALATERNGRFLRVLGPGSHRLGRFEVPISLIDVRPQERKAEDVRLLTRDGIDISTTLSVSFKVSPGSELPSREQPFPFDYNAVRNVAYADTNTSEGIKTWDSVPLTVAEDQLKALIAEYNLDDFVFSERSSVHFHQLIAGEMERRTRDILARFGVQIISARLGLLRLPERVTSEHIEYWRSGWDAQRKALEAEGEAWAVEEGAIARAQAQAIMIEALLEGINRARQSGLTANPREIAALRMLEVMETFALQSQQLVSLPEGLMLILGNLRKQIVLDQGGLGSASGQPYHPVD